MSFFPPLALINKYYIGDTVLLTGIAEALTKEYDTKVYVVSNYPELLDNHPYAIPIHLDQMDNLPNDCRIIDMSDSIRSIRMEEITDRDHKKKTVQIPMDDKLKRMFEQAGSSELVKPSLFLREEEIEKAKHIRRQYGGKLIGIGVGSRHDFKIWAYYDLLVKNLFKDFNIFIIHDNRDLCDKFSKYPVKFLTNLSLRELMINIYAMDYYIGNDSGPAHIACALNIPSTVIGISVAEELYSKYNNVLYLSSEVIELKDISVRKVLKKTRKILSNKELNRHDPQRQTLFIPNIDRKNKIALFRLDGLGGSITLTDQAKKIYDLVGIKPILVTRSFGDIFKNHPYIEGVIEVGHVKWDEALEDIKEQFDIVGEERFGIGKWHQKGKKIFDQDFSQLQNIFDKFPINYKDLEIHGLHHIQLIDKTLGLPYDTIESKIYYFEDLKFSLPENYIVVNDGVDSIHQGMRQTKVWNRWDELVGLLDFPIVQVGTHYDQTIKGVDYDLRDKTRLGELASIVRGAHGVITTEGGLMHLAYAVDCPNVFVLRGPTRGKLFEYPGHHFIDSYLCDICWSSTPDWYINCVKQCDAVCMTSITAERVAYNVREVLNEN